MLTFRFEGLEQDMTWYLIAIYANCKRVERRELWWELAAIRSLCDGPWVLCGDFNITRYPGDEFSDWINDMELVDPPLFGGSYTWRRSDNHESASRIDRFLYSSQWEEKFLHIKQSFLPKIGSDHNPIMLTCGDMDFKKPYFKFEQWWIGVEGFKEKVKEWWVKGMVGFFQCIWQSGLYPDI